MVPGLGPVSVRGAYLSARLPDGTEARYVLPIPARLDEVKLGHDTFSCEEEPGKRSASGPWLLRYADDVKDADVLPFRVTDKGSFLLQCIISLQTAPRITATHCR